MYHLNPPIDLVTLLAQTICEWGSTASGSDRYHSIKESEAFM